MEYAGLDIPIDLCIALPCSRQIGIGNAGPASALESAGANLVTAILVKWTNSKRTSNRTSFI